MSRPILAILLLLPQTGLAGPRFQPVTIQSHIYGGGWEHFVGGGVATFDCDGDNLPELYAAGGANPAVLLRNTTPSAGEDLAFTAATPAPLAQTGVTGAYPLDIDGDGMLDLAVLRVGENLLLKGGPDCGFTPFPADLGFISDARWTTAFSATWESDAVLPTLAFGNYVDRTDPTGPFEACDINQLYRPAGTRYAAPLPLAPGFCTLSALFSDWSRSGRPDLRLSNDRHYYVRNGQEQLWAMEETPRLYGPEDGWEKASLWGMGIASRDLTGDGRPEVYLSSMGDQKLQVWEGPGPTWRDVAFERGTTAQRPHLGDDGRPSTGWHIAFGDVDNDGRDDVFIAKGNVEQMPSNAMEDPNSLLMQGADGVFSETSVSAGVASPVRSRGAALVDMNLDGLLDLAVVNRRAPMEVYQNVTETDGHWVSVALRQPGPNRQAVGAWIELRAGGSIQTREVTVGGGHASGAMVPAHFGLGPARTAELRVTWPDGEVSEWMSLAAGTRAVIDRQEMTP